MAGYSNKKATVSGRAAMAINLLNAYELGILPRSGGWLDQDSLDVDLILLAGDSKSTRQRIENEKSKRQARTAKASKGRR